MEELIEEGLNIDASRLRDGSMRRLFLYSPLSSLSSQTLSISRHEAKRSVNELANSDDITRIQRFNSGVLCLFKRGFGNLAIAILGVAPVLQKDMVRKAALGEKY